MLLGRGNPEAFLMTTNPHNLLASAYKELRPQLEKLKEEVVFVLQDAISQMGIKTHAIHSRVKEFPSVEGKIARIELAGGKKTALDDLDDLVGIRVVCLFLSDLPQIGNCLHSCFNVEKEDNKIDGADITSFGYQSVHFICELPDSYAGPRYDSIKKMRFEIQVRTIAMDAWAAASHYLDYKNESGVPIGLRKDFYALSGLFYVADTHFEMFYKEAQRSREKSQQVIQSKASSLSRLLDFDTLSEYLKEILPDRARGDSENISLLLDELLGSGFKTLEDVDSQIKIGMLAFLQYEKDHPPGDPDDAEDDDSKYPRKFLDIGVIRILLEIMSDEFRAVRAEENQFADGYEDLCNQYRAMVS